MAFGEDNMIAFGKHLQDFRDDDSTSKAKIFHWQRDELLDPVELTFSLANNVSACSSAVNFLSFCLCFVSSCVSLKITIKIGCHCCSRHGCGRDACFLHFESQQAALRDEDCDWRLCRHLCVEFDAHLERRLCCGARSARAEAQCTQTMSENQLWQRSHLC